MTALSKLKAAIGATGRKKPQSAEPMQAAIRKALDK
jgi:hypothetical protein